VAAAPAAGRAGGRRDLRCRTAGRACGPGRPGPGGGHRRADGRGESALVVGLVSQ